MGYLDGSTVTVDAILTKQGRRLLAEGKAIDVKYFCLSDTGVDYNLWNIAHPSGSAYYGEAIEDLPQLEALPNAAYFMRNKLVTLNKDTTAMPIIAGIPETHNFGSLTVPQSFTPQLLNHSEPSGYYLVVPNLSQVNVTGGSQQVNVNPNLFSFINEQDVPANAIFTFNTNIRVGPKAIFDTDGNSQTVVFVSITTGAFVTCKLTWDKNIQKAPVTQTPKK